MCDATRSEDKEKISQNFPGKLESEGDFQKPNFIKRNVGGDSKDRIPVGTRR